MASGSMHDAGIGQASAMRKFPIFHAGSLWGRESERMSISERVGTFASWISTGDPETVETPPAVDETASENLYFAPLV